MKRKSLVLSLLMIPVLVLATVVADVQAFDPLALGALGTAMGFAVGGSARDAAIGGAAGVAAGLLLTPPAYARGGYGYSYGYASAPCDYECGAWVPGHYDRYGYWVPGHYRSRVWVPGHYNRYGEWVPGHYR